MTHWLIPFLILIPFNPHLFQDQLAQEIHLHLWLLIFLQLCYPHFKQLMLLYLYQLQCHISMIADLHQGNSEAKHELWNHLLIMWKGSSKSITSLLTMKKSKRYCTTVLEMLRNSWCLPLITRHPTGEVSEMICSSIMMRSAAPREDDPRILLNWQRDNEIILALLWRIGNNTITSSCPSRMH